MRLIASLTTLTASSLLLALMAGCAGNAPKKPAATDDKSATAPYRDDCFDAQARGAPPPYGCPQSRDTRRTTRPAPVIGIDPPLPSLPSGGAGGVLGR